MARQTYFLLAVLFAFLRCYTAHARAATKTPESTKNNNDGGVAAVRGLLERMLPSYVASQFELQSRPLTKNEITDGLTDFFQILPASKASGGVVLVQGSSGVAMASGVRHYLWNYAHTSFSWWGDNLDNLPPGANGRLTTPPTGGVRRNTTLKYRMAMNSCAFAYSTP